ncbi:ATP-grasp domain-containing protein [Sandaracinus amylolyticus]|nr:ATP-grasp domain-containing protein [Sandaracinus amylolyticus]
MRTLILSRRHTPDSQALWRAAVDAGWDVVRAQRYAVPPELAGRTDVAFYAETLLADALAPELGVVLLEPDVRWLAELPSAYRLREIRATTLAAVREVRERAFVKPADEKVFAARVYEPGERIDEHHALPDALPVLVSEPVRFEIEVRAFVVDREAATLSAYVRDGDIARAEDGTWPLDARDREDAITLLASLLADPEVALPPAVVIDVGRIEGRGFAVVEANAAWAAGICGCDPDAVLRAVARTCVPTSSLDDITRRWARAASLAIE